MEIVVHHNKSSDHDTTNAVAALYRPLYVEHARNTIANRYKCPYMLTPDQMQILQGLIHPTLLTCEGAKRSTHAIAAALRDYSIKRISRLTAYYEDAIDIGGTIEEQFRRGNTHKHTCSFVNSSKDFVRVQTQSRKLVETNCKTPYIQPHQAAFIRDVAKPVSNFSSMEDIVAFKSKSFCIHGTQTCNYRSKFAISIHSMYDIPVDDLPHIFNTHGLEQIMIVLFLPIQLLGSHFSAVPSDFYNYSEKNGKSKFSFPDDLSFVYEHDTVQWRKWLTTTSVRCKEFAVSLEIIDIVGCAYTIKAVRTPFFDVPKRTLNNQALNNKYILVPNMYDIIANDFKKNAIDVERLVAPREFVTNLYNFSIGKEDEKFSFSQIFNYARCLTTGVNIAGKNIRNNIKIEPHIFNTITTSVIIMAASTRVCRTKLVSAAFEQIKEESKDGVFKFKRYDYGGCWKKLSHLFCPTKDKEFEPPENSIRLIDYRFNDFKLQNFSDVVCQDSIGVLISMFKNHLKVKIRNKKNSTRKSLLTQCCSDETPIPTPRARKLISEPDSNSLMEDLFGEDEIAECFPLLPVEAGEILMERLPNITGQYDNGLMDIQDPWQDILKRLPTPEPVIVHTAPSVHPHLRNHSIDLIIPTAETYIVGDATEGFVNEMFNSTAENTIFFETVRVSLQVIKDNDNVLADVYSFCGVPGSGKTHHVIECLNKTTQSVVVVTPTSSLKDTYVSRCNNSPNTNVFTFHSALNYLAVKNDQPLNIVLEEAFLFPVSYVNLLRRCCMRLFIVGDPYQIRHIDFSAKFGLQLYDESEKLEAPLNMQLKVSRRCPHDVVKIINTLGYDNIVESSSLIRHSIRRAKLITQAMLVNSQVLTFTQMDKSYISGRFKHNAKSVHEKQGATYNNVILYVTNKAIPLIERGDTRNDHLIVALTRHTDTLTIVDQGDIVLRRIQAAGTNFEIHANIANLPLYADNVAQEFIDCKLMLADNTPVLLGDQPVDVYTAENVMGLISDSLPQAAAIQEVRHLDLPEVGEGSIYISGDALLPINDIVKGYRLENAAKYARLYSSRDSLQTVRTAIKRYMRRTITYNDQEVHDGVDSMLHGLNKFVDLKNLCVEVVEAAMGPLFEKAFIEYFNAMTLKNPDLVNPFTGDFAKSTLNALNIAFFMKTQAKFENCVNQSALEMIFKDKVGQGVSAWSKVLNVYFSTYVRLIHELILQNLNPSIVIANGEYEDAYSNMYAIAIDQHKVDGKFGDLSFVANDFSEFDSSQSQISIAFDTFLLSLTGIDPYILEMYKEQRSHWKLSSPNCCVLSGNYKKHSGEPATLTFNTTYNMAVMGMVCQFDKLVFAGFKGDDSVIVGVNVRASRDFDNICKSLGVTLKFFAPPVVDFVGYVLTDRGFFPDIIRRFCKLQSSHFRDYDHFLEVQKGVAELISMVQDGSSFESGKFYLCALYGITGYEECIELIYKYLLNFSKLHPRLIYVENEPLHVS